MNPKVFTIWAKYLVFSALTSVAVIGKFPLDFTASDWKNAANGIWVAIVPVVIKWANPKDELTFKKIK